jgi:hypothetical protein
MEERYQRDPAHNEAARDVSLAAADQVTVSGDPQNSLALPTLRVHGRAHDLEACVWMSGRSTLS